MQLPLFVTLPISNKSTLGRFRLHFADRTPHFHDIWPLPSPSRASVVPQSLVALPMEDWQTGSGHFGARKL